LELLLLIGAPIGWWEWSRCDHSARAERAAGVTTGPVRMKPAGRSARRDGSQRQPFHRVKPFHRSVWCAPQHPRTNCCLSQRLV